MNKSIKIMWAMALGIVGVFWGCGIFAEAGLVGIINNCRDAEITVTKADGTPFTVTSRNAAYFLPINIPDNSNKDTARLYENAMELTVKFLKKNALYTVKMAQTDRSTNLLKIEGKAESQGKTIESLLPTVYVTNAMNAAHIPGISTNPWQGIVIVFGDDADLKLPFKFALSAWASNIVDWCGDQNHTLKIKKAPDTGLSFGKGIDDKDIYLNVIQGQQALGGGVVPRPKRAHLVHIYNNTSRALDFKRTLGGGKGESILIPPYSAIPYIMAWIPIRTTESIRGQEELRPGITISVLRPQVKKAVMPIVIEDALLEGAAGIKAIPTTEDIDEILKNMGFTTPGEASKIMGTTSIENLMKPAGAETKFYSSSVQYKIWVPENENYIKIYSRDLSQDDITDTLVMTSPDPAYVDYTHPGYFSLLVNENKAKTTTTDTTKTAPDLDTTNPLSFTLTNLKSIEKPYINLIK